MKNGDDIKMSGLLIESGIAGGPRRAGDGGSITLFAHSFQPGRGGSGPKPEATGRDGAVRFCRADGVEMLRLDNDGIWVRGRLTTVDCEIAKTFKEWMCLATLPKE